MSIKDKFFSAVGAEPAAERVSVPGFGELVVRGLKGSEWDRYESACVIEADGKRTFTANRALLARLSVIDPDSREHLFDDDDLGRLADLPAQVLNPIAAAASRLSGNGQDAEGN